MKFKISKEDFLEGLQQVQHVVSNRTTYEKEIYSPYDYMGIRLGSGVKVLATILFTVGSILGQSVRVLVAAIPLKVVTGMDINWLPLLISLSSYNFGFPGRLIFEFQTRSQLLINSFLLFVFY